MKRLMYFAAVLAIAVGCTGNELTAPVKAKYTLNAEFAPETKTSIDDEGAMMWQANDKISVMDENLGNEAFELITKADTKLGQFQAVDASYEGTPVVAVYPYNDNNYSDGEQVVIKLPAQYEYDGTTSHAPMLATVVNDGLATGTARFSHIAGLIKVTYENVPKSATSFELVATTGIVGEFEVNISDPVINASSASSYGSSVSYDFENTEDNTDMVFYVPVPCGEYGFRVALYDADLNKIAGTGKKVSSVAIEKGDYFVMPTITLAESPSEGESINHTIEWAGKSDWTGVGSAQEISLNSDFYGYSVVASKAEGSTNPTVMEPSDANSHAIDCRVYAKGTVTVSNAYPITKLVFNLSTQGRKRLAPITASTGTIATQASGDTTVTWTGNATSVTFTVGEKAVYGSDGDSKVGQFDFNSIDATYFGVAPQVVAVTGVTLDQTTLSLEAGETATLLATVAPENATNRNVTWESSNTAAATVANGVVTAVAAGTSTITVKTVDGEFTATCEVTVTGATYSTIAQVFAGGVGTYSVKDAVVMAKAGSNVILSDGTANIMLYEKNNTLEVGQVLTLNNQTVTDEYNSLLQFSAPTYTVATDKVTPDYGTPVEILSDDDVTSWGGDPQYQYIHFVGIMGVDNKNIKCGEKGIYIAATAGYAGKKVSVYGYANGKVSSYGTITTTLVKIEDTGATSYTVTIASDIENGTVKADLASAVAGAEITLTATPATGYQFSAWDVKDASNNAVSVTDNKFKMPESNVTVSATFELIPAGDDDSPYTFTFSALGYSNAEALETVSSLHGTITLSFSKGTGSTAPAYYNTGTAARLYGSNTLTISSEKTITGIVFNYSSTSNTGTISAGAGSYSLSEKVGTWSGSANSVTFTNTATSGHARVQSIVVTFE